ncbi:MAG: hypothetical protein M1300_07395 [Epsilonproteobacteria bacterium]|nr:hypothetical protein [Campylobacterota bacterium]
MTVTDNQLILAAVCGIGGIAAAFMPFIASLTSHLMNNEKGDDSTSLWMFVYTSIQIQFIVSVFFHGFMRILDATMKSGMKVIGDGGAFDLFWKVDIIYATVTSEMITTTIKIIRDFTMMLNAFLPIFAVMGGVVAGYHMAAKQMQSRGTSEREQDFFSYGLKMFMGGFVASVVYYGWAAMASYTMLLPSAYNGGNSQSLSSASAQYWRQAVGIKTGGKEASKITIQ